MNPRFGLLSGLVVGAFGLLSIVGSDAAEARGRGRVWFGGGGSRGSVSWGTGSVRWSRPAPVHVHASWSVGGSVYVGSPAPRYRYYRPYYYSDSYVPSYYGTSYYPVAPAPAPSLVVVAERPDLPKFGIGLFAGGVAVQDQDDSNDMGILGRLRLGNSGLLIEGELGKTSYTNDLRVDRRLGASLIWEIGARNRFAPYLLAGMGVQQADVANEFQTTQNFAEIGVGVRYAVTSHIHLTADIRAGSRNTLSSDSPMTDAPTGSIKRTIAPPTETSDDNENYTRARLSAILYF